MCASLHQATNTKCPVQTFLKQRSRQECSRQKGEDGDQQPTGQVKSSTGGYRKVRAKISLSIAEAPREYLACPQPPTFAPRPKVEPFPFVSQGGKGCNTP